jgi:vacuolar protein sorting-associated protein 13A/C
MDFIYKYDEIIFTGSLGKIQLNDLTNYPETLCQESDWPKIVPVELVGEKVTQDSLMKIKFINRCDSTTIL